MAKAQVGIANRRIKGGARLATAAASNGADRGPVGAQGRPHLGQGRGNQLPLGLDRGAIGKGDRQGLLEAEGLHSARLQSAGARQTEGRGRQHRFGV